LNLVFLSGLIYVALGLYLGPNGINVLSPQILKGLTPLISLGLGWIGFLFGFQLEYKYLRRFPRKYLRLSFFQSLTVVFLVSLISILALRYLFSAQTNFIIYGLAVAFGLLTSLNSPTLLNAVSLKISSRGEAFYLARFLVSISAFWGILGLAFLACFWHYPFLQTRVIFQGSVLFGLATLLPFLLGFLFHRLTKKKASDQDLLVYLLGLVFFVSGVAFYFNLPPLYMCLILGISYTNLTKTQERLYPLLLSTEKPLFILFLILIGAFFDFRFSPEVGILVGILLVGRIASYSLPLPLLKPLLRLDNSLPILFGLCFLSSGGVGVAFAVSLKLTHPLPLTDVFLSAALVLIIVSEVLGPVALRISLEKLDSEGAS